jgi:hypothetical protein
VCWTGVALGWIRGSRGPDRAMWGVLERESEMVCDVFG